MRRARRVGGKEVRGMMKKALPELKATAAKMKKSWKLYLCLLPFLSVFFVFTVLPVLRSVWYSFCYYNVLQPAQFIGLDNYKSLLLKDDVFVKAVINTLTFAVFTGPGSYLLSLLLAWMINDFGRTLRTVLVIIFYAPSISGQLFVIWQLIFSGDSLGYANVFLTNLGIIDEPIQWLTDTKYMMPICIIVALWMSLGPGFLSFVAGFQGIDRSLYEAAAIDGINNRYQELWYITLPAIRPQMMFGAVMSITAAFGSATIMQTLCGFPSTDYAAHTIVTHLFDYGSVRFDMGYACTISTILFLIMVLLNRFIQRMLRGVGN